jgi:hypothetical protein
MASADIAWGLKFLSQVANKMVVVTPVILAIQEAETRRIMARSQPGKIVLETLSQKKKKPSQKRAGGVVQGAGPNFKTLKLSSNL